MEIEIGDQTESEAEGSKRCTKGWRRFVADVLSCFTLVGVAIRRAFTWKRNAPEPETFELENENIDTVSIDSSFTIRALENYYSALPDFGETDFKPNNGRKPNASRGNASRKRSPINDRACFFEGKYATLSEDANPAKIDIRERGEPNTTQEKEIPKGKEGFLPGKTSQIEHEVLVHKYENVHPKDYLDGTDKDLQVEKLKETKKPTESRARCPENVAKNSNQEPPNAKPGVNKKKQSESNTVVQNSETVVRAPREAFTPVWCSEIIDDELKPTGDVVIRYEDRKSLKECANRKRVPFPPWLKLRKEESKNNPNDQSSSKDPDPKFQDLPPLKTKDEIPRVSNNGEPNPKLIEKSVNKTDVSPSGDNQTSMAKLKKSGQQDVQNTKQKQTIKESKNDSSKASITVKQPPSAKAKVKPDEPRKQDTYQQKVNAESQSKAQTKSEGKPNGPTISNLQANQSREQEKESCKAPNKNILKSEDKASASKKQVNPKPEAKAKANNANPQSKKPEDNRSSSKTQTPKPKESVEKIKDESQTKPKGNTASSQPKTEAGPTASKQNPKEKTNNAKTLTVKPKAEAEPKISINHQCASRTNTNGATASSTQPRGAEAFPSSNQQPNPHEILFTVNPSIMPMIGDDIRTMQIKMLQQMATIEQFQQRQAAERGLPTGPMYPFSPSWLLAHQDDPIANDPTEDWPSQEEGSTDDDMSPYRSRVQSDDAEFYEDDFTSEDEEEAEEEETKDNEDDHLGEESNSSTPKPTSDQPNPSSEDHKAKSDESRGDNTRADQSNADLPAPKRACGKRSDADQSEEKYDYERNHDYDYEENVVDGDDQHADGNPTKSYAEPTSDQKQMRRKGLNEEEVNERLKEIRRCWNRFGKAPLKSARLSYFPNRRSKSPVILGQEYLRKPTILRVIFREDVYHLKLKKCTICRLEFEAFVPNQENPRIVCVAPSKIPVRTKSPFRYEGYREEKFDFAVGLKHLSYKYLRVIVKIHGKRLSIPLECEREREMVRQFIRNPRSSLLTDPPGIGQVILDKAMALLGDRSQRRCFQHTEEQLEYHKWFSQCNASTKTQTSSPKTRDVASNVSFESDEECICGKPMIGTSDKEPELQPSRPKRRPLPEEEMQEPQPFTDDLFAERTEQLLAERAERERKNKAVQQTNKSSHNVRKTFANKFTCIEEKYICSNPSKRHTNEIRFAIGFVPKNEKWIQVDVEADTCKEHIRKEDLIDASAYPIQSENFDIGTYRMDECVTVQKAKKGHLEGLGGKQKVKTRGIPNKHLEKHHFEEDLMNLENEEDEDPEEEETVFGNPEINETLGQKPIFVEDESAELDMRHMEEKPCKVLQKRRSVADPPTPVKNKNRKKRHRTNTGPKTGATNSNLAETLFDFSHSRPNQAKKR